VFTAFFQCLRYFSSVLWVLALALIVLAHLSGKAQAAAWPTMDAPPKSTVEWVSDDMKIQGLPTRVKRFDSRASPIEIMSFYKALWQREGHPAKDSVSGHWVVVSRVAGPFLLTAQARAVSRGSTGYLSISQAVNSTARAAAWYAPPAGAKLASDVESNDPGLRSHQLLYFVDVSPETARSHVQDQLIRAQYTADSMLGDPTRRKDGYAMAFRKPGDEVIVTIHRQGTQTAIALNRILIRNGGHR
jgi:hypothetical protein